MSKEDLMHLMIQLSEKYQEETWKLGSETVEYLNSEKMNNKQEEECFGRSNRLYFVKEPTF